MNNPHPLVPPLAPAPVAGAERTKIHCIEAQEIRLCHPEGGPSLTFSATRDVAGLWISPGANTHDGPLVAIWAGVPEGAVCIGRYATQKEACAVAVSLDQDGEPYVQLRDPEDGSITLLSLAELKSLRRG